MNKDFTFPSESYYDFSNGVAISEATINRWITDGIAQVKDELWSNPDQRKAFYHASSGNTTVIVEAYRQDNGKYTVYVNVATSVRRQSECNVEF